MKYMREYALPADRQAHDIRLRDQSVVRAVACQGSVIDTVILFVEIDDEQDVADGVVRRFQAIGANQPIPDDTDDTVMRYVGTAPTTAGFLVYHVFEHCRRFGESEDTATEDTPEVVETPEERTATLNAEILRLLWTYPATEVATAVVHVVASLRIDP